jgi:hypothetical protein
LNLEKCTFGVPKGKVLGYILFEHGIKADPKKIMAITKMGPIRNVRFISRLSERGIPLYKLLKKSDTFVWMEEAQ